MSRTNRRRSRRDTSAVAQASPAYIHRQIPYYDLLSDEGLDKIERHADDLLKEHGIEIRGDDETLRLFKAAGAEVSGERVRFEPGLVKHLASTAPESFTHVARNPERSVTIGGDNTASFRAF